MSNSSFTSLIIENFKEEDDYFAGVFEKRPFTTISLMISLTLSFILLALFLGIVWFDQIWSRNYQPVSCHRQNCLGNKHSPGRKTNPIKLLGTRQHIKLGSRQQAGNSVFFLISCCRQKTQGNLYIFLYLKNSIAKKQLFPKNNKIIL